jgi:hypothetical protein
MFEDRTGIVKETPARVRQLDAASEAMKQQSFDFLLELLDLLTERGLGDPEALGGAPEMLLLGGDDKIAEVAKLHPSSSANPEPSSIWCSYRI